MYYFTRKKINAVFCTLFQFKINEISIINIFLNVTLYLIKCNIMLNLLSIGIEIQKKLLTT